MTKTDAIATLAAHYGAPYGGSFIAAPSGDLIQDIHFEGDMGKTFHRFGTIIVESSHLIPLAAHYA